MLEMLQHLHPTSRTHGDTFLQLGWNVGDGTRGDVIFHACNVLISAMCKDRSMAMAQVPHLLLQNWSLVLHGV